MQQSEQLQTLSLEEAFAHELAKDVKLKGGGTAIVCCEQLDRRSRRQADIAFRPLTTTNHIILDHGFQELNEL